MTTVVIGALVILAIAGLGQGVRHLYFRLDRPRGFECSLRVVHGTVPGLTPKFRAGHAGPEVQQLLWRRIAWPGAGVRFPVTAVRIDRARRPVRAERIGVPSTFDILPVELADGTQLELALPRRRIPRLIALVQPPGPRH